MLAIGPARRVHWPRNRRHDRHERKLFFEQLLSLREAYRAERHEAVNGTIEDVLAAAERMFVDATAAEAAGWSTRDANTAN